MTVTDPFAPSVTDVAGNISEPTATISAGRNANQRYAAAQTALRVAHPDEFRTLLEAEYQRDGVTYRARLTVEEREAAAHERKREAAAERLRKIKDEFPDLEV